jgi:hypothetical protein
MAKFVDPGINMVKPAQFSKQKTDYYTYKYSPSQCRLVLLWAGQAQKGRWGKCKDGCG